MTNIPAASSSEKAKPIGALTGFDLKIEEKFQPKFNFLNNSASKDEKGTKAESIENKTGLFGGLKLSGVTPGQSAGPASNPGGLLGLSKLSASSTLGNGTIGSGLKLGTSSGSGILGSSISLNLGGGLSNFGGGLFGGGLLGAKDQKDKEGKPGLSLGGSLSLGSGPLSGLFGSKPSENSGLFSNVGFGSLYKGSSGNNEEEEEDDPDYNPEGPPETENQTINYVENYPFKEVLSVSQRIKTQLLPFHFFLQKQKKVTNFKVDENPALSEGIISIETLKEGGDSIIFVFRFEFPCHCFILH